MASLSPLLKTLTLTIAISLPGFWTQAFCSEPSASQEKFSFTILHSNDLHSHEDSFLDNGKIVGGIPRIAHLIKTAKKNNKNVLAVDAGDAFQGTAYFETYKGETDIECLSKAGYDIFTIGNHDFDEGSDNLAKQLKHANFDVISCNLDVSGEPDLKERVKAHVIKELDGEKIAFVGVITPALKELAPKLGPVKLISPGPNWMEPVKAEVAKLKEEGINKIILVSHCGVDLEKLLAEIPDVDLVIGGHSHTRLDEAIIVPHPDGSKTMVVQTGSYGRALGRLDLAFDKSGKLLFPDSKYHLINLSEKIFEDPELKDYVSEKAKPFAYLTKTVLSTAEARFDNRFKNYPWDSPIGDLISDALLEAGADYGATISLQNRGGIRAPLDQGQITLEKVREILPFQNKMMVATITGKTLLENLEHNLSSVETGTGGRFFDMAGLKYAFDPTLPLGQRVVFAFAQTKEGDYEAISADQIYRIATNDYTFNGGEGYDFKSAKDVVDTGLRLSTVLENYLKKHKTVAPAIPNRFLRVSTNIAKRKTENGNELLSIDYPAPNAELSIIVGSDKSVSFLPKFGVVPLADPRLLESRKSDDAGRLEIQLKDLQAKASRKKDGKGSDGKHNWVSIILKSRDKEGNSTRIVSVPIQID
ncbi:MAG: bifunctional metallophosphatase/5'-nucleotidase [Candidatus Obscuribacterales bacterium]|nr:bifunctional metallophosphatase/5'-nucleotidase [Candidatus Obscuribacterales bacterium]